jgi:hypothetical protein
MSNKLMLLAVAALALAVSLPGAAHADAIANTNQAIIELTDPPGVGGRTTVDLNKRWGSDVGQMAKAVQLLQDALSEARGSAPASAVRLLEEAVAYGQAREHKEARLSAQGALHHLCKGAGGGEGCEKAPKVGSYVAP